MAETDALIAALRSARATVETACQTAAQQRVAAPVLAQLDRALASAQDGAGISPVRPADGAAGEVESLRREVERLTVFAEQRELLDAVLEQSPHGIIISDPSGRFILQNAAAEHIWAGSASVEAVSGLGKYRAFHKDGRPFQPDDWSIARCLSQRTSTHSEEKRIERFDGTAGWLLGSASPIFGSSGALIGAVWVFADITAQKQTEATLQLSEERFATTLRSIGDAVIATDQQGGIRFMNRVAEELTGWTFAEASGRPLREAFHIINETSRLEVPSPVEKVLHEGVTVGLANHTMLLRRDGTEVAIDDSAAPIRDAQGALRGVVLVFRDVTEKRLEDDRRSFLVKASALLAGRFDYQETLAAIAQLAVPHLADWCSVELGDDPRTSQQVAVAHVDPAKVVFARELRKRMPPDPKAPVGVPNVLRTGKPELVPEIPPGMIEGLVRDDEELRIIRELKLRSFMVVPLIAHGKVLGAISFVAGDSERRFGPKDLSFAEELANCAALAISNARLFDAERQARASAEHAREFEQQLMGIVSHDLRSPLSAMVMSASVLMKREDTPPGAMRALARIVSSGERAARLIRDLLDFTQARLGSGIPILAQPMDLHRVALQVVDEVRLSHPEREISFEASGTAQGSWDPDRIAQLLTNLLVNAATYSPAASRVQVRCAAEPGGVLLEVRNQGEPISPGDLPVLFEPFKRGRDKGPSGTGSAGLGLYIVQQLVKAHGGTIEVESTREAGTAVRVRLPLARA